MIRVSFAQWMHQVDLSCKKLSGVSIHDLQDEDFQGMYEDGTNPVVAARRTLTEAGF